jgi:hypothetical protein
MTTATTSPYARLSMYLPLPDTWHKELGWVALSDTNAMRALLSRVAKTLTENGEVDVDRAFFQCVDWAADVAVLAHWRVVEVVDAAVAATLGRGSWLSWAHDLPEDILTDCASTGARLQRAYFRTLCSEDAVQTAWWLPRGGVRLTDNAMCVFALTPSEPRMELRTIPRPPRCAEYAPDPLVSQFLVPPFA